MSSSMLRPHDALPVTESFSVYVKLLTGRTHTFQLSPDQTMLDLKKRIEQETSIPIDQQLLLRHVYKFHELPDDTRVSDTLIVSSDGKQTMTINLLPRSPPPPVVSISNGVRTGYNQWAISYDSNVNPTRDSEGKCLRKVLNTVCFNRSLRRILEIGCGTGKNSAYFLHEDFISRRSSNNEDEGVEMKPFYHLGIDLSPEMLSRAQQQFPQGNFKLGDITLPWQQFLQEEGAEEGSFDLVAFSLVLEHIEDLHHIFEETAKVLSKGGLVYLGELHPIKQYLGSKARFEVPSENVVGEKTTVVLPCFIHHLTDFTQIAGKYGLQLLHIEECFDEGEVPNSVVDGKKIPRILSLLFVKQ